MAGRIPKSFIDELIGRADIVEVVGARVTLKRAGSNYKGLCPFHGEKTPSFTVSPSKGFYHCFGCSAHGTAIGFLMAYDNLEFPEAVEALAEMMGLEVPRENTGVPERKDDNDELYALLREADQIYRATLRSSDKGDRVFEEARHRRADRGPLRHRLCAGRVGYGAEAARHFGRAHREAHAGGPRRRERLRPALRPLSRPHHVPDSQLAARPDHRLRRPRARLRRAEISELARDADLSQRPRALRPLRGAADSGRPKQIIVNEGYLDVASLVQHGIENAVATLGTATTAENLRRLTRLTDRILFCFDGDRAGRAAAWRALETALPYGGGTLELKFLLLPEGDDPDSFVRTKGRRRVPRFGGESRPAVGLPRQRAVGARRPGAA